MESFDYSSFSFFFAFPPQTRGFISWLDGCGNYSLCLTPGHSLYKITLAYGAGEITRAPTFSLNVSVFLNVLLFFYGKRESCWSSGRINRWLCRRLALVFCCVLGVSSLYNQGRATLTHLFRAHSALSFLCCLFVAFLLLDRITMICRRTERAAIQQRQERKSCHYRNESMDPTFFLRSCVALSLFIVFSCVSLFVSRLL